MNKLRRKELNSIIEILEEANSRLEMVKDEEQEAFDNLPEGIQYSERGEQMEEYVSQMDEAYDSIQEAIDTLTEIAES